VLIPDRQYKGRL